MRAELENEYVQYARACTARLHRIAYMLCGDAHRADDVVQETLASMYVRWPALRSVDSIDAYVRTMLVRSFLRERRRPWSRVRLDGVPPETARPDRSGAPVGDAVEDRDRLVRALARVPARQRAVLVLRFLCDMSVEDVATTLRCSAGTVKSQTSHGLAAMRRLMDGAPQVGSTR
jgi:RNA polymerase sigma-70 factor (sigma-E family)